MYIGTSYPWPCTTACGFAQAEVGASERVDWRLVEWSHTKIGVGRTVRMKWSSRAPASSLQHDNAMNIHETSNMIMHPSRVPASGFRERNVTESESI